MSLPLVSVLSLVAASMSAPADARRTKHPQAAARIDSEPRVRIRGFDPNSELTPLQFAQWLRRQSPRMLAAAGESDLQRVSMRTALLNRTADEFREADTDGNGRLSALEVANLIAARAARQIRT